MTRAEPKVMKFDMDSIRLPAFTRREITLFPRYNSSFVFSVHDIVIVYNLVDVSLWFGRNVFCFIIFPKYEMCRFDKCFTTSQNILIVTQSQFLCSHGFLNVFIRVLRKSRILLRFSLRFLTFSPLFSRKDTTLNDRSFNIYLTWKQIAVAASHKPRLIVNRRYWNRSIKKFEFRDLVKMFIGIHYFHTIIQSRIICH